MDSIGIHGSDEECLTVFATEASDTLRLVCRLESDEVARRRKSSAILVTSTYF